MKRVTLKQLVKIVTIEVITVIGITIYLVSNGA